MLTGRQVTVPPDSDEDSGASESTQIVEVPPWPKCSGCGKMPDLHARRGATLYCDEFAGSPKGDFGPNTVLVVASVYAAIGAKLPEGGRSCRRGCGTRLCGYGTRE